MFFYKTVSVEIHLFFSTSENPASPNDPMLMKKEFRRVFSSGKKLGISPGMQLGSLLDLENSAMLSLHILRGNGLSQKYGS